MKYQMSLPEKPVRSLSMNLELGQEIGTGYHDFWVNWTKIEGFAQFMLETGPFTYINAYQCYVNAAQVILCPDDMFFFLFDA